MYDLGAITILMLLYVREKTYITLLPKNLNIFKNKKSKILISKDKKLLQIGQIKWNNFKFLLISN